MTLNSRSVVVVSGIVLTCLILTAFIIVTPTAMSGFPELLQGATGRPRGFLNSIIESVFPAGAYAPLISGYLAVIYALIGLILIQYYFEKTQAPEIFYITIFTLSLSLEAVRIVFPLVLLNDYPGLFFTIAARVLLFGRYLGLFAFFFSGVIASGLEIQKHSIFLLVITVGAFMMAMGAPIDNLTWDSGLDLVGTYQSIFLLVDVGLFITTIASYLIAARSRGELQYLAIAAGAFFVLTGRTVLLYSDNYFSPFLGFLTMCFGGLLLVKRLHKVYLWL
jgi:hypothetical protein